MRHCRIYIAMQGVLFTPTFERQAKDAGLSEDELMAIASSLAENPLAGDLMTGTGGARKKFDSPAKVRARAADIVPFIILAASMCRYFFSFSSIRARRATCRWPNGMP